jgi:hypothetical protein
MALAGSAAQVGDGFVPGGDGSIHWSSNAKPPAREELAKQYPPAGSVRIAR